MRRYQVHHHSDRCLGQTGTCVWGYPMPIAPQTTVNENGRVVYRRRRPEYALLVPTQLVILRAWGGHVCAEVLGSIGVYEYLLEYLLPSGRIDDTVLMSLGINPSDHGLLFAMSRRIGSMQGCWRILGGHTFPLVTIQPSVLRLSFLVPMEQGEARRVDDDEYWSTRGAIEHDAEDEHDRGHDDGDEERDEGTGVNATGESRGPTDMERWLHRPAGEPYDALGMRDYHETYRIVRRSTSLADVPDGFTEASGFRRYVRRRRERRGGVRGIVSRILSVRPSEVEMWSLLLILRHGNPPFATGRHRQPRTIRELRTVRGLEYATFQEAAVALGFLSLDDEIEVAIREAIDMGATPRNLRVMATIMLEDGALGIARAIEDEQLLHALTSDFTHTAERGRQDRQDELIAWFDIRIRQSGRSFAELGLADWDDRAQRWRERLQSGRHQTMPTVVREAMEERERMRGESRDFLRDHERRLADEQHRILDEIVDALTEHRDADERGEPPPPSRIFFIEGGPGRGKTFLMRMIIARLIVDNRLLPPDRLMTVVASTGIAASQYATATTAHARFHIAVHAGDERLSMEPIRCQFESASGMGEFMRRLDVILWDEAASTNARDMDAVSERAADCRERASERHAFGGVPIVILAGDFRQTPPVTVGVTDPSQRAQTMIHHLPWWRDQVEVRTLITNHRANADPELAALIDTIVDGTHPTDNDGNVLLPAWLPRTSELAVAAQFVFPDNILDGENAHAAQVCAHQYIASVNADATTFNENLQSRIAARATEATRTSIHRTALARHQVIEEQRDHVVRDAEATMAHFRSPTIPDSELALREGEVYSIARNLHGARLARRQTVILDRIGAHVVVVRHVDADGVQGEQITLPTITFPFRLGESAGRGRAGTILIHRHQFPLMYYGGTTMHGVQSRSLSRVVVDLRRRLFDHGQLGVAISRVLGSRDGLLLLVDPSQIEPDGRVRTQNIVFQELLLPRTPVDEPDGPPPTIATAGETVPPAPATSTDATAPNHDTTRPDEETNCVICLTPVDDDDGREVLACGSFMWRDCDHWKNVHLACLRRWATTCRIDDVHCMLCRRHIGVGRRPMRDDHERNRVLPPPAQTHSEVFVAMLQHIANAAHVPMFHTPHNWDRIVTRYRDTFEQAGIDVADILRRRQQPATRAFPYGYVDAGCRKPC
eukprot:jgi/Mesvir1/9634/Mv25318-RA.1